MPTNRRGPQDCMDWNRACDWGDTHICQCCEDYGTHWDLPGNNPERLEYPCEPCRGTGQID